MDWHHRWVTIFVVISVVVCGSTGNPSTHVMFPGDPILDGMTPVNQKTPGHMGIWLSRNDDIPLANDGDEFTWIQVPGTQSDLYFPTDGRQPTTLEAAVWSCANIDNSLTSPITEWYMRMFGWQNTAIPGTPAVPLQMGFILTPGGMQTPREIVSTTSLTNSEPFWAIFRQIAANPVGRVLLYRLLIEIRRQDTTASGALETGIYYIDMNERNNNRSIQVDLKNDWEFSYSPCTLAVNFSHRLQDHVLKDSLTETESVAINQPAACIHELIHWFHFLRNPIRTIQVLPFPENKTNDYAYVKIFYPTVNNIGLEWRDNDFVDEEDMRTILGASKTKYNLYLEGDDLSENLFRLAYSNERIIPKTYLRFGHRGTVEKDWLGRGQKERRFAAKSSIQIIIENILNICSADNAHITERLTFYVNLLSA